MHPPSNECNRNIKAAAAQGSSNHLLISVPKLVATVRLLESWDEIKTIVVKEINIKVVITVQNKLV